MRSLCVFCGSSSGNDPAFLELARDAGARLAGRGLQVVYGGGKVGLMGALADGALAAGGRVIGVIPQFLLDREVGHLGLTELRIVSSMSERKLAMAELSDGFLTLPGSIGTMDELFEAWTWLQLGFHRKPVGLLNHAGYYDGLIEYLDRAVHEGFLRPRHRDDLHVESDLGLLLDRLQSTAQSA